VRQLLDRDGSSVVIHALPDNKANIPPRYRQAGGAPGPDAETRKAGDSGRRVACGVIG
jgi:Cu-Zn family superoxide dismutase